MNGGGNTIYKYLGLYDEGDELYVVKIKANTREEADNKFMKYLKLKIIESKINEFIFKDEVYVIPLFAVKETI